jgi:hypothetical protein
MMDELRATFNSDRTRSKAWRVSQLKAFLRMIEEEGPLLCDAMLKDLHKSPLEGGKKIYQCIISGYFNVSRILAL